MSDRLVLHGHGHPAVRASHGKTLEFSPSAELGAGGTCIVAVGSQVDGAPLAGVVRGELTAAGQHVIFEATANPDWDPTGPAVLRRSAVRRPDTVATHASIAASDLAPDLRAALRDPEVEVRLEFVRLTPQPDRLVIAKGEIAVAERAAADLITQADPAAITGRVLHLGSPSAATLTSAPQPVEVLGYQFVDAVAVASPSGRGAVQRSIGELAAHRAEPVVVRIAAGDFDKSIRTALRRGRRTGAVLGRLPWVQWGELSTLEPPAGVRSVWLCLDPVPSVDLDQRIAELQAAGTPVKQIARDLSAELGLPARAIYQRATGADS